MRKLLLNIISLLLTISLLAFVLEFVLTTTYKRAKNSRLKTAIAIQISEKDSLDYALFGSSRSMRHVNPILIEAETNLKGYNFGCISCQPFEIKLLVFETLKRIHLDRIFIQVDYSYNEHKPNKTAKVSWYPFLKEKDIYSEFSKFEKDAFYLKNIPLYRYLKFDSKIGFRQALLSVLKKPCFKDDYGYVNSTVSNIDLEKFNYYLKDFENPQLKEIIAFCKKKRTDVYFYTSPIYSEYPNHIVLKKYLPNYTDFSMTISQRSFFNDALHLNKLGDSIFTKLFIKKYFVLKDKSLSNN
jgi:hypothetical protein